jgi:hypothetical protein
VNEVIGRCDHCGREVTEEDCYQVLDEHGAHLYCDDCPPEEGPTS